MTGWPAYPDTFSALSSDMPAVHNVEFPYHILSRRSYKFRHAACPTVCLSTFFIPTESTCSSFEGGRSSVEGLSATSRYESRGVLMKIAPRAKCAAFKLHRVHISLPSAFSGTYSEFGLSVASGDVARFICVIATPRPPPSLTLPRTFPTPFADYLALPFVATA